MNSHSTNLQILIIRHNPKSLFIPLVKITKMPFWVVFSFPNDPRLKINIQLDFSDYFEPSGRNDAVEMTIRSIENKFPF